MAPTAPVAERRLVSVLFADLVGHTTFSEGRDAEDVRELLSRYFETARTVIERYGGTVEKFIGDAVMAVWGAPVAREDDPERAVRAALDLLDAVHALRSEVGASSLEARAGVLTGEAAITIGAEGQGMVAGDLVNTASRIQSAAEPGTVLVGDDDQALDGGRNRLRGRRRAHAQGQGRAAPALACGPRDRSPWRRAQVRRGRAGVRRARPRPPPREGALPRLGGGPPGQPRVGRRHRRHRQVPARVGVREVHRRPCRRRHVALRPLPRLRGRCRLLGPGRDGSRPRGDRRGRGCRSPPAPSFGPRSRSTSPTRRSAGSSSRGWATCSGSRRARSETRRTCSPPRGCSSSTSPRRGRPCSSSRTSTGPTALSSTSSST